MFETRKVLHVDGKTHVEAKGRVVGNEFIGEYKFQGMTYGVTISVETITKETKP